MKIVSERPVVHITPNFNLLITQQIVDDNLIKTGSESGGWNDRGNVETKTLYHDTHDNLGKP